MRYVVLGASAAGINGVRQLRKQCPEAEIILVSKDSSIYSRCILHHYLGNMRTKEELCFAEDDFEDRYKADWRKGVTCTGLDDKEKQVCLSDGTSIAYDRLLIATGSHTLLPAVKGLLGTEGVYGFHNLDEVEAIKKGAVKAEHIVVMGGGLTGLDAAVGFLRLGKRWDWLRWKGICWQNSWMQEVQEPMKRPWNIKVSSCIWVWASGKCVSRREPSHP